MKKLTVTIVGLVDIPDDMDIYKLHGVESKDGLKIKHEDGREFKVRPQQCYIKPWKENPFPEEGL